MGVDLKIGDYVRPYGNGEISDFDIKVNWDGNLPPDCHLCKAQIRFCEPGSGGYFVKCIEDSSYQFAYEAKIDSSFETREINVVGRDASGYVNVSILDPILVTRSRCHYSQEGELLSACYGSILGFSVDANWDGLPTIRLVCYFNPTPNDTNLEAKK